jgi:hypothetical protein
VRVTKAIVTTVGMFVLAVSAVSIIAPVRGEATLPVEMRSPEARSGSARADDPRLRGGNPRVGATGHLDDAFQANPAVACMAGECNGDAVLTTADVTCVILRLFDQTPMVSTCEDCNADGLLTTADVTCTILCLFGVCPTTTTSTSSTTTTTLQSGCFVAVGDGTVRDACRGLQWEQKVTGGIDPGSVHSQNNLYAWAGRCAGPNPDPYANPLCQPNAAAAATCAAQTGGALGCQACDANTAPCNVAVENTLVFTTIWDWLNQLNAMALAGHADWRIPTVGLDGEAVELEAILLGWPTPSCPGGGIPCLDPIFGPTAAGPYWSANTNADGAAFARHLNFNTGEIDQFGPARKEEGAFIRAVRTPPRFVDVGLTVLDTVTTLEWEKKDGADSTPGLGSPDPGNLHDVDNLYSWAGCCDGMCNTSADACQPNPAAEATCLAQAEPDTTRCSQCASGTCDVDPLGVGAITTVWDWINQVNAEGGTGFGGHADWRLPSQSGCNSCFVGGAVRSCSSCESHELETILVEPYPCAASPCIASVFGPTAAFFYWSATTVTAGAPLDIWATDFGSGTVGSDSSIDFGYHVRAVRQYE